MQLYSTLFITPLVPNATVLLTSDGTTADGRIQVSTTLPSQVRPPSPLRLQPAFQVCAGTFAQHLRKLQRCTQAGHFAVCRAPQGHICAVHDTQYTDRPISFVLIVALSTPHPPRFLNLISTQRPSFLPHTAQYMYWAIGFAFVNNTNNVTQTLARVAQLHCGSDSMTLTSGACGLPPGRTTTFQVTAATDFRIFSCESCAWAPGQQYRC